MSGPEHLFSLPGDRDFLWWPPILTDVGLSVSPGEILGLVGPNGAGKTSLFEIFTGRYTPAGGSVSLRRHGHHQHGGSRARQAGSRAHLPKPHRAVFHDGR